MPFRQQQERIPADMGEQELDMLLQQLGMDQPQAPRFGPADPSTRRTGTFGPTDSPDFGQAGQPVPQPLAAEGMGGGFAHQLGRGFMDPFKVIPRQLGIIEDERTEPITTGEQWGKGIGQFLGWTALGILTAATLGKGTVAALGLGGVGAGAKAGLAATTVKHGIVPGVAVGGLDAWDRDLPPGEIAKHAGYGAALGAAFPLLGHATRGVRGDVANKFRKIYTNRIDPDFRARPEDARRLFGKTAAQQYARSMDETKAGAAWSRVQHGLKKKGLYDRLEAQQADQIVRDHRAWKPWGPAEKVTIPGDAAFNKLPNREKLGAAIKTLGDDPQAQEALKPVIRPFIKSAFKTRKFSYEHKTGIPINKPGIERDLTRLGQAKGVPLEKQLRDQGIDIPGFDKQPLRQQLETVRGRAHELLKRQESLIQSRGVADKTGLTDPKDIETIGRMTRHVDNLEAAHYRLMPQVEDTLQLAKTGGVPALLAKEIDDDARAVRGEWSVENKSAVHPKLIKFLKDRGAMHADDLSPHDRGRYFEEKWKLGLLGEQTEDTFQYVLNHEKLFPMGVAQDIKKEFMRMPAPAEMTSHQDVLLKTKPGLWDGPFTPKRAVFGETTAREMRVGIMGGRKFSETYGKIIEQKMKPVLGKGKERERELITRWLWAEDRPYFEGKLRGRDAEIFTPEVRKAAQEADKIWKAAGKALDIPEDAMKRAYAPRKGTGMFERTGADLPPELSFFAQEQRTGFAFPHETDVVKLLQSYIHAGQKKKFLDPVFRSQDKVWDPENFVKRLKKEMKDFLDVRGVKTAKELSEPDLKAYERIANERQHVMDNMSDILGRVDPGRRELYRSTKRSLMGIPSEVDSMTESTLGKVGKILFGADKHGRYTREIASWVTWAQYTSTLGFNMFSPIKNLTQQILPIATLDDNPMVGIKYWAKAQRALMGKKGRQFATNTNHVLESRVSSQALAHQQKALQNVKGARSFGETAEAWRDGFSETGMYLFKKADRMNVQTSHMMKMLHLMDTQPNMPLSQMVENAYSFTMSTQFMYGFDAPMMYQGDLGRTLGVLMSWPLNYAHLMREQVGQRAFGKAASMATMGVVGAEALSASGLSFQSVNPLETAQGMLPVAMLEGQDRMPLLLRGVAATGNYLRALGDGDPRAVDHAQRDFGRALSTFVPYMTQGRRVVEGAQTMWNDYKVTDDRDRMRYQTDFSETFRGMIGPTVEARERWNELRMVSQQIGSYQRMRKQAMEEFFDGDYESFARKMDELVLYYGKGIEPHEIRQEAQLREQTALERRAIGLPTAVRDPMLEGMQAHRADLQETL